MTRSCILSKFYIKPQQLPPRLWGIRVVSYRNSTSNHNVGQSYLVSDAVVSYRNSTSNHNQAHSILEHSPVVSYRNSTSNHNTSTLRSVSIIVVSYRNSTSNHNHPEMGNEPRLVVSYRNSTSNHNLLWEFVNRWRLYLIEILHQTTTRVAPLLSMLGCILSKFYIKPQQMHEGIRRYRVVSYRNSTSNHNAFWKSFSSLSVVSYRNSTSNHN